MLRKRSREGRIRVARSITVMGLASTALLLAASSASAAISPVSNTSGGAGVLANAIQAPPTVVSGASFAENPGMLTPNGTADAPLSSFPTAGSTFSILTTGNVNFADDPNNSDATGQDLNGGTVIDGPHARGNTDFDATALKVNVDVPPTANCLTVDFQFYSDEFPEWVNTQYNDAFIAELDSSTWTTAGSAIQAPDNFAFDPSGSEISINASGNTSMDAASAAGTTYDGATPLLSASKQVTPGAHSLYLSIFDQGDQIFDSAVFLDNLRVGFVPDPAVNCRPGAQPKQFGLALSPVSAENPVGTSHTVTATLTDEDGNPVATEDVDFEVNGANSASGVGSTNAGGEAAFTYTGNNAGSDVISACYDADDDGVCEATASATKRWKTFELALSPPSAVNLVGSSHTVTATLTDEDGNPTANKDVSFAVGGANSASGSDSTNASGEATFTYVGNNAGNDTITACYDTNDDGTCEATATATKRWKAYSLSLSPASAENPVGSSHTVTARLTDENGDPVGGETVDFNVSGANSTSGSSSTNGSGDASFSYTGTNTGSDTITACYDANDDGTCEATATASKTWINPNRPPDCSGVTASPDELWPPNHKFRLVTLSGATDPDGDAVTLTVTGVTQDEAIDGKGDGHTAPRDAKPAEASNQVWIRAERSGRRDGRVYEISFTGTDASGATCTGTTTVGVPHDRNDDAVDSGQTVNSYGE